MLSKSININMRQNNNNSVNNDGTYHFKGDKNKENFTDYYDKAFNAEPYEEEELGAEFAEGFHEEINIDIDPYRDNRKENPFQNPNYRRSNSDRYYYDQNGYNDYEQTPYDNYYRESGQNPYQRQNQRKGNGQANMNNNDFGYEDRYTRRSQNQSRRNQNRSSQSKGNPNRNYPNRNQNSQQRRNSAYNNGQTYPNRGSSQSRNRQQRNYNNRDYNRSIDRDYRPRDRYSDYDKRGKRNKNGKKKRKFSFRKFLLILILLVLIIFGLLSALILHYIGLMNLVDTGDRVSNSASVISSSKVENILIIGSDSRTEDENARSDSMILLSVNKDSKQIVQTSFMRDMYVEIPGFGENKINAAYNNGGPELVMDTIEQNFNIQIDNYIQIDFFSFIDIIDSLGGLDIKISDAEAQAMTDPLGEQNKYLDNKRGTDYLTKGGKIHMNGNQALAYARIRHIAGTTGTDFGRTDRQRKVLNMIIDKIKSAGIFDLNKMLENVLPKITTNMTKNQLYFLSIRAPFILSYERVELRIPYGDEDSTSDERYWEYGTGAGGSSILIVDFDKNSALLRKTIYGY